MIEMVKEKVKGKNDSDVEELIKLLTQHLVQPDKHVRRGSGRRGPRTRSLCTANELEKQAKSGELEENNNDPAKVISELVPTVAVVSDV